ncbi:MAG TPA: recombinase family protein [Humisphaera sp.]
MYGRNASPMKPRNGHTLVVGIVARISGCANQKELSLDDQVDHAKHVVADLYEGPVEYVVIATTGKGERLDRPELEQIEAALRAGGQDLMVMEDLGRLCRGIEAVRLFGVAVDHGTRAISPNDAVDTAEPTWEEDALAACRDHVAHNAHTSKRLKQKLMNRFLKFGGATARPIAGYAVPADARTYDDWRKQDAATAVIREGLRRLGQDMNCEAVAEFFNAVPYDGGTGFPPGPYCRRRTWDGKMVRRLYRNRLLGGAPGRGFRHTVKRHESGRRVSVANPGGPQFQHCPHLAHVDLAELDAVNLALAGRNGRLGRRGGGGTRRRTRFPGGVGTCGYCGRPHVWGGNGTAGNLMCSGSRAWRCWCSVGYDGARAAAAAVRAITEALQELNALDGQFKDLLRRAARDGGDAGDRRAKLAREEADLARRKLNVRAMMAELGPKPLVLEAVKAVEAEEARLAAGRRDLDRLERGTLNCPGSADALRRLFEEHCGRLASDSREFNNLLSALVPTFEVRLVRLVDGGHPLPRAELTIRLDGLAPDLAHVPEVPEFLTRRVTVDLFEPPQRAAIRARAVALAAEGLGQREVAARLGVTQTAVHDALDLERTMRARGLADPYVPLAEPPADYPKLRRHRNRKYRFERLEGRALQTA